MCKRNDYFMREVLRFHQEVKFYLLNVGHIVVVVRIRRNGGAAERDKTIVRTFLLSAGEKLDDFEALGVSAKKCHKLATEGGEIHVS